MMCHYIEIYNEIKITKNRHVRNFLGVRFIFLQLFIVFLFASIYIIFFDINKEASLSLARFGRPSKMGKMDMAAKNCSSCASCDIIMIISSLLSKLCNSLRIHEYIYWRHILAGFVGLFANKWKKIYTIFIWPFRTHSWAATIKTNHQRRNCLRQTKIAKRFSHSFLPCSRLFQ